MSDCCPKGHKLENKHTEVGGYQCNTCDKTFPTNTFLHCCRICDYDICGPCFIERKNNIVEVSRKEHQRLQVLNSLRLEQRRKLRLIGQWCSGFVPPFLGLVLVHHLIDVSLNRSSDHDSVFRVRLGVTVFSWIRSLFYWLYLFLVNVLCVVDSILANISNSILESYPFLAIVFGYGYPYKNAPIISWAMVIIVTIAGMKQVRKYRKRRRKQRQELLIKELKAKRTLQIRKRALERFQAAGKRIIMLNFRARLLSNFIGKKEAQFRKYMKRPLVNENFFKTSWGDEEAKSIDENGHSLHQAKNGGRENILKMWGRGAKVGVQNAHSFANNTHGFGFVNAAGTWDICCHDTNHGVGEDGAYVKDKSKHDFKWLHNISKNHLRWDRRELKRAIAKNTDNPKKLLKFNTQAQEEEVEEFNALCYGRPDSGKSSVISGKNGSRGELKAEGMLEVGTMVEVLQMEGGSILGHIRSIVKQRKKERFWGGVYPSKAVSENNESQFKKDPSRQHKGELLDLSESVLQYQVLFLDNIVETIPAENIRRVWLYSVDMKHKRLSFETKQLKVPTKAFVQNFQNDFDTIPQSSFLTGGGGSDVKRQTLVVAEKVMKISQQREILCKKNKIEAILSAYYSYLKYFASLISMSSWLTVASGIISAFIFDILSRNDVTYVKFELHPFFSLSIEFIFKIISILIWWLSELIVVLVHSFYRIIMLKYCSDCSLLDIISKLSKEWRFWWRYSVYIKYFHTLETAATLINHIMLSTPQNTQVAITNAATTTSVASVSSNNSNAITNITSSSIATPSLIKRHFMTPHSPYSVQDSIHDGSLIFENSVNYGRVWFISLEVSLNKFGVELLVVTLVCLGVCGVGALFASGVPFQWLERCTKSFLKIFEESDQAAEEEEEEEMSISVNMKSSKLLRDETTTKKETISLSKSKVKKVVAINGEKVFFEHVKNLIGLRCFVQDRLLNEYDSAVIIDAREHERRPAYLSKNLLTNKQSQNKVDEIFSVGSREKEVNSMADHLHNDHLNKELDEKGKQDLSKEMHRRVVIIQEQKNDRLRIDIPYQYKEQYTEKQICDDELILRSKNGDMLKSTTTTSYDDETSDVFNDEIIQDSSNEEDDGRDNRNSSQSNHSEVSLPNLLVFDVKFEGSDKIEYGVPSCYVQVAGAPPFIPRVPLEDSSFVQSDLKRFEILSQEEDNILQSQPQTSIKTNKDSKKNETVSKQEDKSKSEKSNSTEQSGTSSSQPLCPLKHILKPLPSHHTPGSLDQRCCRCFRYYAASLPFHGCSICDFSVCPKCTPRCIPKNFKAPLSLQPSNF